MHHPIAIIIVLGAMYGFVNGTSSTGTLENEKYNRSVEQIYNADTLSHFVGASHEDGKTIVVTAASGPIMKRNKLSHASSSKVGTEPERPSFGVGMSSKRDWCQQQ
jgi:hypothetical protein